jgi:hypothetical protein
MHLRHSAAGTAQHAVPLRRTAATMMPHPTPLSVAKHVLMLAVHEHIPWHTHYNKYKAAREPSLLPVPPTGVRKLVLETAPCGCTPCPASLRSHPVCCAATQHPTTHFSILHHTRLQVVSCWLRCSPPMLAHRCLCFVHVNTTTTHGSWLRQARQAFPCAKEASLDVAAWRLWYHHRL